MNNDNDLNLHSMTKLSGWLHYCNLSNSRCFAYDFPDYGLWISRILRTMSNPHAFLARTLVRISKVLQKNCGFIRDQDRNMTSLVATSFYNCLRTKAICFSKITAYLTFSYVIPYKISHVYLPGMRVRMTYPSHPRGTRNTPSCTSICILNLWYASSFQKFPGDHAPSAKLLAPLLLDPLLPPDINQWRI